MLCVVFRRVGPALRACGSLRSLAAASRTQAISPNITVFVAHGLTFVNFSALGFYYVSPHPCKLKAQCFGEVSAGKFSERAYFSKQMFLLVGFAFWSHFGFIGANFFECGVLTHLCMIL